MSNSTSTPKKILSQQDKAEILKSKIKEIDESLGPLMNSAVRQQKLSGKMLSMILGRSKDGQE